MSEKTYTIAGPAASIFLAISIALAVLLFGAGCTTAVLTWTADTSFSAFESWEIGRAGISFLNSAKILL